MYNFELRDGPSFDGMIDKIVLEVVEGVHLEVVALVGCLAAKLAIVWPLANLGKDDTAVFGRKRTCHELVAWHVDVGEAVVDFGLAVALFDNRVVVPVVGFNKGVVP